MPEIQSHAPTGWECIFCLIANGGETKRTKRDAIVLQSDTMTAFVASHWWPNNPGHVLVIPNQHTENIYDFPTHLGNDLIDFTQRIAVAMKTAYRCDGISTRQHNEPAGHQDVWHFHQHVFPRWHNDHLYQRHNEKAEANPANITQRAAQLREAITTPDP